MPGDPSTRPSASLRMTEALPLPGELRTCTARGRRSKFAISAAVGECKEMRKPAAFSGHRKVEEKAGPLFRSLRKTQGKA